MMNISIHIYQNNKQIHMSLEKQLIVIIIYYLIVIQCSSIYYYSGDKAESIILHCMREERGGGRLVSKFKISVVFLLFIVKSTFYLNVVSESLQVEIYIQLI